MNKIKSLDNKLRRDNRVYAPIPNISGGRARILDVKEATDYILSDDDIKMLLEFVDKEASAMILVKQGGMGFYPKYDIVKANYIYVGNETPYVEIMTSFTEKQLPKGWDFDRLSKSFNSEKNLEKIEFFKQEKPRKKDSYYY